MIPSMIVSTYCCSTKLSTSSTRSSTSDVTSSTCDATQSACVATSSTWDDVTLIWMRDVWCKRGPFRYYPLQWGDAGHERWSDAAKAFPNNLRLEALGLVLKIFLLPRMLNFMPEVPNSVRDLLHFASKVFDLIPS